MSFAMSIYCINFHIKKKKEKKKDAHQGGVITSQTTLCRNLGEKEGEGVFLKGAY